MLGLLNWIILIGKINPLPLDDLEINQKQIDFGYSCLIIWISIPLVMSIRYIPYISTRDFKIARIMHKCSLANCWNIIRVEYLLICTWWTLCYIKDPSRKLEDRGSLLWNGQFLQLQKFNAVKKIFRNMRNLFHVANFFWHIFFNFRIQFLFYTSRWSWLTRHLSRWS